MRASVLLSVACSAACVSVASADVLSVIPAADAFVDSALPTSNFGGAGALAVAAPGLPQGEFQSLLRFDTSSIAAGFNATFGVGLWTVQSVTLRLTAANPNSPLFNSPSTAGQFAMTWMSTDDWTEGTGNTGNPTMNGVSFSSIPDLVAGGEEAQGSFSYGGAVTGAKTYTLTPSAGLLADVSAGGLVTLRLAAEAGSIAYVFNSRSFPTQANRPLLSVTAIPGPGTALALLVPAAAALRRRRNG